MRLGADGLSADSPGYGDLGLRLACVSK